MNDTSESEALVLTDPGPAALVPSSCPIVAAIITAGGEHAARRFLEFFAVTIENAKHPRGLLPGLQLLLRLVRGE
jgi:hypothetical protein